MDPRAPTPEDADVLGAVHVRAWQAAYKGGLMPDDYLDALSAEERAEQWGTALEQPPGPRRSRFVVEDVSGTVTRQAEVLGVEVPELRYSISL